MASLFGAVATEVGSGIKENVASSQQSKAAEAERLHDMQLNNMRMKQQRELTTQQLEAQDKRDQRRMEFDTTQQENLIAADNTRAQEQRDFMADEGAYERESRQYIAQRDNETDLLQTYLQARLSQGKKTTFSSGSGGASYDVDFGETEGFTDMTTGTQVPAQATIELKGAGPLTGQYVDLDGQLRAVNATVPMKEDWRDLAERMATEDALIEGRMTPQEFSQRYGYLPKRYVFTNTVESTPDFKTEIEQVRSSFPVLFNTMPPRNRRRRGDNTTSNTRESQRLREMSEAGIEPTNEDGDEAVRRAREADGREEYPPGVEPGSMGSPYTGDFQGGVSDYGRGMLRNAEELERKSNYQGETVAAGSLSDNDASDIAANVAASMRN